MYWLKAPRVGCGLQARPFDCVLKALFFFVSNADMGEAGEGQGAKTLETLWKSGREGTLCPLEQAKAWGFREAQRARGEEENFQEIADSVVKVGGGHPSRDAVRKFFDKVEGARLVFPFRKPSKIVWVTAHVLPGGAV